MSKEKLMIHYGVINPIPWHMYNVRFACGQIYGKFTHYKPDVTCKSCKRTKRFKQALESEAEK